VLSRGISALSYVLATALTLLFAGFIDVLMTAKLRAIQMVESMKAVE
jgi:hypothetical protein